MDKVLIVLASTTSAYSVKTMLEKRYKIYSKIVQAPAQLTFLGCAYCLEIDMIDLNTALSLVKASAVSVRGVYNARTLQAIDLQVVK